MKKPLAIFLVVIAVCSLTLISIPSARSQVSTVKILSYSYYWDAVGMIDVVGEIQNQGPNVIEKVLLTGVITGDGGNQLNSYCQVWGQNLLPNQKAPFYMEFYPQTQDGQSFAENVANVALTVYSADPTTEYQYQDLAITNQQAYIGTNPGTPSTASSPGTGDLGVFWVTGTVQNTGSQTAQNVTLVGTFYNSTGQVVAVGLSDIKNPPSIAASSSYNFKFGAYDMNQSIVPNSMKIATYSLLLQNIGPMANTTTGIIPVASFTPTPPPLSSTTPAPTSNNPGQTGTVGNPVGSTDNWTYIAAAIAVVAIVVVVATFLLMKRRNKPSVVTAPRQSKPKPKKPNRYR